MFIDRLCYVCVCAYGVKIEFGFPPHAAISAAVTAVAAIHSYFVFVVAAVFSVF